jgi:hypothetical protein
MGAKRIIVFVLGLGFGYTLSAMDNCKAIEPLLSLVDAMETADSDAELSAEPIRMLHAIEEKLATSPGFLSAAFLASALECPLRSSAQSQCAPARSIASTTTSGANTPSAVSEVLGAMARIDTRELENDSTTEKALPFSSPLLDWLTVGLNQNLSITPTGQRDTRAQDYFHALAADLVFLSQLKPETPGTSQTLAAYLGKHRQHLLASFLSALQRASVPERSEWGRLGESLQRLLAAFNEWEVVSESVAKSKPKSALLSPEQASLALELLWNASNQFQEILVPAQSELRGVFAMDWARNTTAEYQKRVSKSAPAFWKGPYRESLVSLATQLAARASQMRTQPDPLKRQYHFDAHVLPYLRLCGLLSGLYPEAEWHDACQTWQCVNPPQALCEANAHSESHTDASRALFIQQGTLCQTHPDTGLKQKLFDAFPFFKR